MTSTHTSDILFMCACNYVLFDWHSLSFSQWAKRMRSQSKMLWRQLHSLWTSKATYLYLFHYSPLLLHSVPVSPVQQKWGWDYLASPLNSQQARIQHTLFAMTQHLLPTEDCFIPKFLISETHMNWHANKARVNYLNYMEHSINS